MATDKLKKGVDAPLLEGGVGSLGGAGGAGKRYSAMTPKERAALENPGKQFETSSPIEARATEKARKYQESMSPKERAEMEKVGEQFRINPEGKKKGGVVRASVRADGIASRGKTRGRMI
jgi:hypothetical protein